MRGLHDRKSSDFSLFLRNTFRRIAYYISLGIVHRVHINSTFIGIQIIITDAAVGVRRVLFGGTRHRTGENSTEKKS